MFSTLQCAPTCTTSFLVRDSYACNRLNAGREAASHLGMSRICDYCDSLIQDEQTYYHCGQCENFDICERCYSDKKRCRDEQHTLLHNRVRGDAIVDATTGNLVHYSAFGDCPGCSWEKSGKPEHEGPFRYEAFPDDSFIRVIDLAPGPEDQPLRYSIHYARLDSLPRAQYVASE